MTPWGCCFKKSWLRASRFNVQARTKKNDGEKCYPFRSVNSQDKQVGLIQLRLSLFLVLFQSLLLVSHPAIGEGGKQCKERPQSISQQSISLNHFSQPASYCLLLWNRNTMWERQRNRNKEKLPACYHRKSHWFLSQDLSNSCETILHFNWLQTWTIK